jgi:DNA-directed RNA polymerase specialized sigma24 family protein
MSSTRNDPSPAHRGQPLTGRAAGDEHRLYITHANRLRRIVGRTVNTSDANVDDACSFAWLQLLTHRVRQESVLGWLVTVAVREAWRLDRLDRQAQSADDELEMLPAADDCVELRLLLGETLEELEGIHPRRRRMLLLHAVGFTSKEIAASERVSHARATQLIYSARLQLRKRTGREDVDAGSTT